MIIFDSRVRHTPGGTARLAGRLARGLSALALLALVVGSRVARADCSKDSECKGERICDGGHCAAPKPRACSMDTECPGNQLCAQDHCVESPATAAPATPAAAVPPSLQPATRPAEAGVPLFFATPGYVVKAPAAIGVSTCNSPCTLRFNPDRTVEADFSGAHKVHASFLVPTSGGQGIVKKKYSPLPFIGGGVLVVVGAVFLELAPGAFASYNECQAAAGTSSYLLSTCHNTDAIGDLLLGLVGVVGGVLDIVAGTLPPRAFRLTGPAPSASTRRPLWSTLAPTAGHSEDGAWTFSMRGRF